MHPILFSIKFAEVALYVLARTEHFSDAELDNDIPGTLMIQFSDFRNDTFHLFT